MDLPSDEESLAGTLNWPHAPPHELAEAGVYFVTARTRENQHLLSDDSIKDWFEAKLLELAAGFGWRMEAWCVLSNHYHFVAHSPKDESSAGSLSSLLRELHSRATREINQRNQTPGRGRLWQNYRETHLTYQRSYLSRLSYVHQNAVHHRLVRVASDWKWCSAAKFQAEVTPAWRKTVLSFHYNAISAQDGE